MMDQYAVGVDGGGSRCRVRIRDAAGNVAGEAVGGNANVFQDFDAGIATIAATAVAAARDLPPGTLSRCIAGLGLAGVVSTQSAERVRRANLPFHQVVVHNDAYIACLGAHAGADGGIVIAGTGSAAMAIVNGREHAFGGWGFALGDDGSGALIGRSALRLATLAADGVVQSTPLLDGILAEFDRSRHRLTEWARHALPRDYASYAPRVFAAADAGDPHATSAIGEAAAGIAGMLRRLQQLGAPRLSLVGGLAALYPRWLPADLAGQLRPPEADAVDGAIVMARRAAVSGGGGPL